MIYWNLKTDDIFKNEWSEFKDDHSTTDHNLKYIFEIYLPFWQCKQNIVVEKDLEMDRFSKILLKLICDKKYSSHKNICRFLGIEEDNFCTMQLAFLIGHGLIREVGSDDYEITYEGLDFLEKRKKPRTMEVEEFDYMAKEIFNFLENDMTNSFFDPFKPIDKQLSDLKKGNFSGYRIMQTHRIGDKNKIEIKHNNNPTYKKVETKRNDFSEFFSTMHLDKIFYDFADNAFESHKRSICFLGFWYEHEEKPNDRIIDIRQFKNSVEIFKEYELERELSKKVTEYVMKNDVRVENSHDGVQESPSKTKQIEPAEQLKEPPNTPVVIKMQPEPPREAELFLKIPENLFKDSGKHSVDKEEEVKIKDWFDKNKFDAGHCFEIAKKLDGVTSIMSKVPVKDLENLRPEFEVAQKKEPHNKGKRNVSESTIKKTIENRTQVNITQNYFKFCSECGKKLKANAKFCTQCGTKQDMEVE